MSFEAGAISFDLSIPVLAVFFWTILGALPRGIVKHLRPKQETPKTRHAHSQISQLHPSLPTWLPVARTCPRQGRPPSRDSAIAVEWGVVLGTSGTGGNTSKKWLRAEKLFAICDGQHFDQKNIKESMIHVSENLLHILHRTRFFTMADCQNLQAQVGRLLLGPLRSWRGSTCHQKFHRRNIPSDAAEMKRQWAQLSNQSREMPWTWSTLLIFLASFPNLDWIVILLAIACSGGGSCCHDSSRHGWACPEASRGRIVCNYVLVSQGLCSPNHELESLMNSIQILAHSAVIQADLPIFPVYIVLPARSAQAWHQPCGIEGWVGNGASCCSLGCGSCMQIGEECWECPPHIFRSALCHTRYVLDHIRMMMIRSLQKMPNDWPNDQVSPGDRFVGWIRHPASWPTFFCFDASTLPHTVLGSFLALSR